jgi:prepilin-type N-terminal cleavage/methylation domain-containing protein
MKKEMGFTLIEILVAIAIVSFIATLGVPQIMQFGSSYKTKEAATDLLQNIKFSRAMAIKESRDYIIVFDPANNRYYMGHDGDGDNKLTTLDRDTFGKCKDTDNDKFPNNDNYGSYPGIPECVKVIDLARSYDKRVKLDGPLFNKGIPPNEPESTDPVSSSVTFPNGSYINIRTNGAVNKLGKVYFQHADKGFTYCINVSNYAGKLDLFKWKGDVEHDWETNWIEVR